MHPRRNAEGLRQNRSREDSSLAEGLSRSVLPSDHRYTGEKATVYIRVELPTLWLRGPAQNEDVQESEGVPVVLCAAPARKGLPSTTGGAKLGK